MAGPETAMVRLLQLWFGVVLVAMLAVTGWATSRVALWDTPREVATHPWFVATLFDTYFAFLAFWGWLAWRENRWSRSVPWLVAILLLGNIAMAVYVLLQLARLPKDAPAARLFERRR